MIQLTSYTRRRTVPDGHICRVVWLVIWRGACRGEFTQYKRALECARYLADRVGEDIEVE